mgnify:CR=1 FL=1
MLRSSLLLRGSLAAALLGLDRYGVELLGEVPAGLPQLSWPQTSLEELKSLLRDATGIRFDTLLRQAGQHREHKPAVRARGVSPRVA